jgi:hypothetical protein
MPFAPLYNVAPVPAGRLHARLMDPGWQAYFRLYVHSAYDAVRELLIAMSVESADRLEKHAFALVFLERLRRFLVESAEDAGPYGFYMGARELRDAYDSACRMFTAIKERLDSGGDCVPIKSLAYIHAKLSGEDPARLIMDANELGKLLPAGKPAVSPSPDEARDRFFYAETSRPKREKLADKQILAKAKREHPEWDCKFSIQNMRKLAEQYARDHGLPEIPRRKYKRS